MRSKTVPRRTDRVLYHQAAEGTVTDLRVDTRRDAGRICSPRLADAVRGRQPHEESVAAPSPLAQTHSGS